MIVAFEKMEALRSLSFLKPDGDVVVNDQEIDSVPVITGEETYPDNVLELITQRVPAKVVNATKLAEELGNVKVANIILLGTIIKGMGLTDIDWEEILKTTVKPQFVEINIKALKAGMDAV